MKPVTVLALLAALVLGGCGGSEGDPERDDFGTIEEASALSADASERSGLAIRALGEGDVATASEEVEAALSLSTEAQELLAEIESEPTRRAFEGINALTLEGYEVLADGIEAAGRGDERATDRYVRESLNVRRRKLQLINTIDFAAIGAGESNERIRAELLEQLRPAAE